MIDLHTHTTASDGLLSPTELVDSAVAAGITILGIADHDTVDAMPEARERAAEKGIEIVSAIEVSSGIGDKGLHLLGYFVDSDNPALAEHAKARADAREDRVRKIVAKLNEAGVDITWDLVIEQSGDVAPSRPHVARALIKMGTTETVHSAFKDWLGDGTPGYVGYEKPNTADAFSLIVAAGGIPVIAHPGLDKIYEDLDELVEYGAKGIEVFHHSHTPEQQAEYLAYATEHNLLVTGGSDFHGVGSEGGQLGEVELPREHYDALVSMAKAI